MNIMAGCFDEQCHWTGGLTFGRTRVRMRHYRVLCCNFSRTRSVIVPLLHYVLIPKAGDLRVNSEFACTMGSVFLLSVPYSPIDIITL